MGNHQISIKEREEEKKKGEKFINLGEIINQTDANKLFHTFQILIDLK